MVMRSRLFRVLSAAVVLLAGLCACQEDELLRDTVSATGSGVSLSFTSDPMDELKVTTRSSDIKDENEKRIDQLYIFFFGSDGEYLKGGYLTGYPEAAREGGYYAPGRGEILLKIDNTLFADEGLAKSATVYAVANVDASVFGPDEDNDGRPDGIGNLSDLKGLVYMPENVSLGLPSEGMPMVGSKVIDLTKPEETVEGERRIELKALMSRIDINIELASDVQDGNLPSLTLVEWTAKNMPVRVPFTAPEVNAETGAGWEEGWTKDVTTPLQRTIFNKNGQIAFTFYMYENVQNAEWKVDEGEQWANPSLAGERGGLYPDSIKDYQKQRYKPYLANGNAAAVELHGFYTTYNGATYEVRYTLYLGANHTDNFQVKRNHQYKNDITIKGLTSQNIETGEYTLDARVNVSEDDNEFYIAMLRERNHDAHFCVTPMDVYMFADKVTKHPTIEVILGEVPEGTETAVSVPEWIRMERIAAEDMANGTVTHSGFTAYASGGSGTHLATGTPWTAGNGKRAFFTLGLLKAGGALANGTKVTVRDSRDRVYFYIDENLELQDRSAVVTLIYKENGREVKRRTVEIDQTHLLPVVMRDGGTIYMEQYEEYLDHYDPLDEYATEQIYTGLPWAEENSGLDNREIEQLYEKWSDIWVWDQIPYEEPGQVFNDGWPYTAFIIFRANQEVMTLNDKPLSAFQYCHNRNKRNSDGIVTASYVRHNKILRGTFYEELSNESKWFLPGIRQMEDALTQYYTTFREFQSDYYWSASAGERENGSSGQSRVRARAAMVLPDGNYVNSGGGDGRGEDTYAYELGRGGYALRTESLRIRAFRVDLDRVD